MGTDHFGLRAQLGDQMCNGLWRPDGMSGEDLIRQMAAAVHAVEGIAPRDEMEGMLAVQMVSQAVGALSL